jgi:hypothetical protein
LKAAREEYACRMPHTNALYVDASSAAHVAMVCVYRIYIAFSLAFNLNCCGAAVLSKLRALAGVLNVTDWV